MKCLHTTGHGPAAVLCAALALTAPTVLAQTGVAGHSKVAPKDSAAAAGRVLRTVYQGEFSYVRIERAEPGAGLAQHPVAVTPELLRAALAALRNAKAKGEAVFSDDELGEIVPAMAGALNELRPDEDLSFAVAGRHGGLGWLMQKSVTTGRMFRTPEGLQLIFGWVNLPFESQYLATGYLPPFEPGRRAAPVDKNVAITPAGGTARRADWVNLVFAPAAGAAAAAAAPAAPPVAAPAAAVTPAAAATAPAPAAAGAATAPAAPGRGRDAAFFEEQENRLRGLKRLRDAGLITEDEYQSKRREVLEKL